jgi:hypothetical protein
MFQHHRIDGCNFSSCVKIFAEMDEQPNYLGWLFLISVPPQSVLLC